MTLTLPTFAGIVASTLFVLSSFPMLYKALTTRNLGSYSRGNLLLGTTGNLVQWRYLVALPFGPIHYLHAYNTVVTLLMLALYFVYGRKAR